MGSSVSNTAQPVTLKYGTNPLHFGHLYVPGHPGPHSIVVLIHGGFWRVPYGLSLMTGLAEDLVGRGIAVWNIEYRRIGDSGGGWPGTLQDVAQATDYLSSIATAYGLDLQRVVSVGHSAGGHLACWLAARKRIAATSPLNSDTPLTLTGVVSLAGAIDLALVWRLNLGNGAAAELLGGSPQVVAERYTAASPAALLPLGVPQVLLHGTADTHVPLIVSQMYTRHAREAGDDVTLIELAEADHFVLIDAEEAAWSITVEWIRKLLFLP
jgi:acetyl esterase/lipase